MRVDHVGHLASIIEWILIVQVFRYNKQLLSPHLGDQRILHMKLSEDMAFVQVCALVFLVAFPLIGFLISQDQEPANYIAPGSFQINQKLICKTVAEIYGLLSITFSLFRSRNF